MASIQKKTTVLGFQNAKHLLKRTVYNITIQRIKDFALKTPDEALTELFNFNQPHLHNTVLHEDGTLAIPTLENQNQATFEFFRSGAPLDTWTQRRFMMDFTINSKLVLFLHSIFVVTKGKPHHTFDYLSLLSFHADDSLEKLAVRVTKDALMLFFLNGKSNRVGNTNENYAREFLELFTILKGEQIGEGNYTNYTEHDVQMATKVFTGIDLYGGFAGNNTDMKIRLNNVNPDTMIPEGRIIPNYHDSSDKQFSSAFNNTVITGGNTVETIQQELNDFVAMVFGQRATALNYARRIYRYFVSSKITPDIEQDIINPLADTLQNNNYNLKIAVTKLLTSRHFYQEDSTSNAIGAKVKTPLDIALSLYSVFDITLPNYFNETDNAFRLYRFRIMRYLALAGFKFLNPIDVNGYPAFSEPPNYDKNWVNPSLFRFRINFFHREIENGYQAGSFLAKVNLADFVKDNNTYFTSPDNSTELLDQILDLLLVYKPAPTQYEIFKTALLDGLSPIDWQIEWEKYIAHDPNNGIKGRLTQLVLAIIRSAEFQIT